MFVCMLWFKTIKPKLERSTWWDDHDWLKCERMDERVSHLITQHNFYPKQNVNDFELMCVCIYFANGHSRLYDFSLEKKKSLSSHALTQQTGQVVWMKWPAAEISHFGHPHQFQSGICAFWCSYLRSLASDLDTQLLIANQHMKFFFGRLFFSSC